jgi:uncharacterized membrane protein
MKDKYWYMQDRIGFFGTGLLIGFAVSVVIMIFAR